MKYIKEMDGVRGLAATGVVFFHMFPRPTFWMWSLIELFFILSGFLVTRILLSERDAGRLSLPKFWMRRVLRVWPVYYVALGLVAVLLLFWKGSLSGYGTDFQLSSVFLQFTQYYVFSNGDPRQAYDFIPSFFHSWSIAVEEQFYFFWPFVLLLLMRLKNVILVVLACLLMLVFSAYARAELAWTPYLLLSRMDGLVLGALLAVMMHEELLLVTSVTAKRLFSACLFVGTLMVLPYFYDGYVAKITAHGRFYEPYLITGFALAYFGFFGFLVGFSDHPVFAFLRHPIPVYLGSISYAMYMFHLPMLVFLKPQLLKLLPGDIGHIFAYALTWVVLLLVCHVSRQRLERPVLALKKRFY